MNKLYSLFFLGLILNANAQVGINTQNPGSSLDVNGSFGTKYRNTIATTETILATDQYIDYKGTANSTFTLPAAGTPSNFSGRIYEIRNGSTTGIITVQTATGAETIDSQVANSRNITIPAGYYAVIKNTGASSGITWVLSLLGQSVPVAAPNIKTLKYATTTTTPIDANTPTKSETCIGEICVRYAGTNPSTYDSNARFQIKFLTQNNYSFNRTLFGSGASSGQFGYARGNLAANQWMNLDADGLTPSNDDMTSYVVSAISTRKLYRISSIISSNKTSPTTASVVKIFVEELE